MNIKNEVLYRVYMVLFLVVLAGAAIAFQTFHISVVEGPVWKAKLDSLYIKQVPVRAPRGNIFASDGSLLATSLPFFEIRFDLMTVDEKVFLDNVDSLALCLATKVDQTYTVGGMSDFLRQMREEGERYLLIKRNATFAEKEMMNEFPIFRLGQFRGGFIVKEQHKRLYPFKQLAYRTVGYSRKGARHVGLEGYFNDVLAGEEGLHWVFKAPGNIWLPIEDYAAVEPERGMDIITTLDINLQDIAHQALLRALNYHNAKSGTAILMDVQTGAIKAIVNLGKTKSGWFEIYNYAVGAAVEPGSTFKLASVMALLEDGYVDLGDTIHLDKGHAEFYEEEMVDAVYHQIDSTTLKHAFEISSNVGIAKLVQKYYGNTDNAGQFIKRLKDMNLHLPTGIEIEGEAPPYIKSAYKDEDQWSGTTLPWMSHGYELLITPLQLLAFYNAVANKGAMMKPYLVSEIQQYGVTREAFKPTILKRKIASPKTISKARELLEAVVENGTAQGLKTDRYTFAGKTGTAQINYKKYKDLKGYLRYRASFAGYFPAEKPLYSCIVMIEDPRQHGRFGSEVAGPVFREIADKVMGTVIDQDIPVNLVEPVALSSRQLPALDAGLKVEMQYLLSELRIQAADKTRRPWTVLQVRNDTLGLLGRSVEKNVVPSVVGMGLRDAMYILENLGLKVQVSGAGEVKRQSIIPGTPAQGQTITIYLG